LHNLVYEDPAESLERRRRMAAGETVTGTARVRAKHGPIVVAYRSAAVGDPARLDVVAEFWLPETAAEFWLPETAAAGAAGVVAFTRAHNLAHQALHKKSSSANSERTPRQNGEGRQSGGYTSGGDGASFHGSMSTISAAGRQHLADLRARLGRDVTVDDLLEHADREIAEDRRRVRIRKTIAVRIRDARRDAGLTQVELASRLGKRDKEINRWEHAHRTPSRESREAIADALGISIARLYPEQEPDELLEPLTQAEDDELLGA
jgi:ribosome-binding protein aMBF1 (putative translation factor)